MEITLASSVPDNSGPVVSIRGRRVRPVTEKMAIKTRQWWMDFRFVREVERLEREGRVFKREQLEADCGLEKHAIGVVRSGMRGISAVNIVLLFEKYRGDMWYIMFGVRDKERSGGYIPGVGNIARYESFYYRYQTTARWKIGQQPESSPDYYPSDPNNELWSAPSRLNAKSTLAKKQKDTKEVAAAKKEVAAAQKQLLAELKKSSYVGNPLKYSTSMDTKGTAEARAELHKTQRKLDVLRSTQEMAILDLLKQLL